MKHLSRNIGYISLFLIITLLFVGAGCQQPDSDATPDAPPASYQDISAAELQTLMEEEENLLLVDVRELHEYNEGHIPGAFLLPLGDLETDYELLERDQTIVLICRSGRRSAEAAEFLVQQGYENVYNLQGGMLDWSGPVEEVQPVRG